MEEDMSYVLNKFQDILKDKNIDINSILGSSSDENNKSSASSNNSKNFNFEDIDVNTILKLKNIINKMNNNNNPRNALLFALKPFLANEKKEKLDQYIKISNILNILELLSNDNNIL